MKRRPTRQGHKFRKTLLGAALALTLAAFATSGTGCAHGVDSGDDDGQVTIHPPGNKEGCPKGGSLPDYCCVDGKLPPTPVASECASSTPGPNPGGPFFPPPLVADHDPILRAMAEEKLAEATISQARPLSLSTGTAAATAGKVADPVSVAQGTQTLGKADAGGGSNGGRGSSPGGKAGGNGAPGSGSGFSPAGLKTAASPGEAAGPETGATGATRTSTDGMYSSSAAGGKTGGSYGAANGSAENGLNGSEGSGTITADMNGTSGSDKDGQKADPANSEDPEDYFKRLSASDDLFKVVTRRYKSKTHQWLDSDLRDKLK